jgi:hypothetical protein
MANDLIPEPNIQATNIPTGGAPQVSFAPWATPKNTFANLSKTIGAAAQTMVNFNDLEDREADSQKAWKEQLEQIHGLTKTGQLSEADYMKIQREANGKAQKEGIIRAHENWSTISDVDKERSGIRLEALSKNLETSGAISRMSNPNENMASTWDDEQALMLESLASESLGTDSQGNEVYLDMGNMSPMEMVAFAKGQSALETAGKLAVEENKHVRAVEASTARLESEIGETLWKLGKMTGHGDPRLVEALAGQHLAAIEDSINKAYNSDVKDINKHVFEAIDSYLQYELEQVDGSDPNALDNANALIDMIESELMLRDGVRFAESGTGNFNTLEDKRLAINNGLATKRTAWKAGQPSREDQFTMWIDSEIANFSLQRIDTDGDGVPDVKETEEQAKRRLLSEARDKAILLNIPYEAKHRTKITGFFGDEIGYIPNEDRIWLLDTQLRTGLMSKTNYDKLKIDLIDARLSGDLTADQFDGKLTTLQSRYENQKKEDKALHEELQKIVDDSVVKSISEFGAEKIDSEVSQALADVTGLAYREGDAAPMRTQEVLDDLAAVQLELQNAVLNSTAIAPLEGYDISLFELGGREDDKALLALKGKAKLMQEGLDLTGIADINERNQAAVRYFQARIALDAYIQTAILEAADADANIGELLLDPEDYKN